jgi:2-polyprenyl-3-methyl-5-hydroxy-6-metoxy-1,4-benzoquinol methylase
MKLIKQFLTFLIEIFFDIYFSLFGRPKISKDLERSIDLYKGQGFSSLFKIIRVWDAPYEEIEKVVPKKGEIIDLGSGDGLMANYLGLSSKKRKVFGIELNKGRLIESDRGLINVKFKVGDILKSNIKKVDAILLIHVFHHLPSYESQIKILEACKKNLNKNGKLIVAEIIQKPFLKYLFTYLTDILILPIVFNNKLFDSQIFYRTDSDWKKLFKKHGFKVKTTYPHQGKPFSHVLYECQSY